MATGGLVSLTLLGGPSPGGGRGCSLGSKTVSGTYGLGHPSVWCARPRKDGDMGSFLQLLLAV